MLLWLFVQLLRIGIAAEVKSCDQPAQAVCVVPYSGLNERNTFFPNAVFAPNYTKQLGAQSANLYLLVVCGSSFFPSR